MTRKIWSCEDCTQALETDGHTGGTVLRLGTECDLCGVWLEQDHTEFELPDKPRAGEARRRRSEAMAAHPRNG